MRPSGCDTDRTHSNTSPGQFFKRAVHTGCFITAKYRLRALSHERQEERPHGPTSPYSEQASLRLRPEDYGVAWRHRNLRTRGGRLAPKHDVLRSTVVLHSTARAHQGPQPAPRGACFRRRVAPPTPQAPGADPSQGTNPRTTHPHTGCSISRGQVPRGTGSHTCRNQESNAQPSKASLKMTMKT